MSLIKSKLESVLNRPQPSDADETEDETVDRLPTNLLHECPECKTVYLSDGSRTCSSCDTETISIETPE